jgi:hypothetical protein
MYNSGAKGLKEKWFVSTLKCFFFGGGGLVF